MIYLKKILITFFLSFILILSSIGVEGSANPEVMIDDESEDIERDSFLISSNGDFYALDVNDTKLRIHISLDSGDTWAIDGSADSPGGGDNPSEFDDNLQMEIDSNDIIHIVYEDKHAFDHDIAYRTYWTNNNTFSSEKQIYDGGSFRTEGEHIEVDRFDNVIITYVAEDQSDLMYSKYFESIDTWIYDVMVNNSMDSENILDIETDASGDIYIFFWDDNTLRQYVYDISTDNKYYYTIDENDIVISVSDVHIDNNGNCHLLVRCDDGDGDSYIKYFYGNSKSGFTWTWQNESIYKYPGYDLGAGQLSITTDGLTHITWEGPAPVSSVDIIYGVEGVFGDWSEKIYYATDPSDTMHQNGMGYQLYPKTTQLTSGVAGISRNNTEDQLMFYSEGLLIPFSGEGEGEYQNTPLGNMTCPYTGNDEYGSDSYGPTQPYIELRDYIGISAEITGFDIYITEYQRTISDLTDYDLYVNGINKGPPDNFILSRDNQYILRWNFSSIVELTDDMPIFEVYSTNLWGGLWYYNIQSGPTPDTQRRHSEGSLYGNGIFDGTIFGQFDKIKYCYYVDTLTQEDPDPEDWFDDQTGDAWVEFFYYWRDCYYQLGDYPYIAYNISSNAVGDSPGTPNGNWNMSLYYLGEGNDQFELISHRSVGHTNDNIIYGSNYLGSFPYEGNYVIYLYNCTHFTGDVNGPLDDNCTLVHQSKPIRVCGVSEDINTYRITITPEKNIYFVNDTVDIKIERLTGSNVWSYRLTDPQFGNTAEADHGLQVDTVLINNVLFADYLDYYYYAEGLWKLKAYDTYNENNKIEINIDVRIEEEYTPYTQEEVNFWIGLGLILVFTFIGIGIATKLDSDSQLGVILLFSTIGGIVSAYYQLIPNYAPFLIGLLLIGYIVASVFGGKK